MFKKGKQLSEEHKRKISEAKKGKNYGYAGYWLGKKRTFKNSKERGIKISKALKGFRHDAEFKEKMRQAKLKNPTRYWLGKKRTGMSGDKHFNWKGGITPIHNQIRGSVEYRLWEDSVFAKNGFYCQKCNENMMPYKLVAHHILNFSDYPELRFAIDNGITFCKDCHKEFHKEYGRKNNTKEQLEEFLKE